MTLKFLDDTTVDVRQFTVQMRRDVNHVTCYVIRVLRNAIAIITQGSLKQEFVA